MHSWVGPLHSGFLPGNKCWCSSSRTQPHLMSASPEKGTRLIPQGWIESFWLVLFGLAEIPCSALGAGGKSAISGSYPLSRNWELLGSDKGKWWHRYSTSGYQPDLHKLKGHGVQAVIMSFPPLCSSRENSSTPLHLEKHLYRDWYPWSVGGGTASR
jgi:hypothetical protein